MGVTRQLARIITGTRFEALGAQCVARVKQAVKDGIAVAVAGCREAPVRILAAHLRALGGAPQASAWGHGFQTSVVNAAYLNGVAIHVLDFEPMWLPPTHAVSPAVPVAFALAEARGLAGREVIAATAKGMEVQVRLQLAADQSHPERLRFHPPGIAGVLGAAVTAAHLLGLSEDQLCHALGLAGSRAGTLLANVGSMTKSTHCGYAAAAGLDAALLASRGFTANPDVFEAPRGFFATFYPEGCDEAKLLAYGRPWRMVDPGFAIKLFPSQFATHYAITAALEARAQIADPRDVKQVLIRAPVMQYIDRPRPATGLDGKFSLQYTVAAALLDGAVRIDTFTDERRFRPDMTGLLEKVTLTQDPEIPGDWLNMHVEVEVELGDGHRVAACCRAPKGGWGAPPLSEADHVVKLRDCLKRALDDAETARLLALLDRLEEQSARGVGEIIGLISGNAELDAAGGVRK